MSKIKQLKKAHDLLDKSKDYFIVALDKHNQLSIISDGLSDFVVMAILDSVNKTWDTKKSKCNCPHCTNPLTVKSMQ